MASKHTNINTDIAREKKMLTDDDKAKMASVQYPFKLNTTTHSEQNIGKDCFVLVFFVMSYCLAFTEFKQPCLVLHCKQLRQKVTHTTTVYDTCHTHRRTYIDELTQVNQIICIGSLNSSTETELI